MEDNFETNFGERKQEASSDIKVIGVGGAGNNAVQHMFKAGIHGVDFMICNTDKMALDNNIVPVKFVLGDDGLGAGGNPEKARELASGSEERIREMIGGDTKMLFITAGMGKGTGTGAAPVVARLAREMGILTVGVVTYPYELEGPASRKKADAGIEEIKKYVDSLIIIQNEKIMNEYEDLPIRKALGCADDVLKNAVKCIAEIITFNAYQNVDFSDVHAVVKDSGEAMIGIAEASGENRIQDVVSQAMTCPLIDDTNISNAKDFLFFVSYSEESEPSAGELKRLFNEIKSYNSAQGSTGVIDDNTKVVWGHGLDSSLGDKIKLSIIATNYAKEARPTFDPFDQGAAKAPSAPAAQPMQQPAQLNAAPAPAPAPAPMAEVQPAAGSIFDFHVGDPQENARQAVQNMVTQQPAPQPVPMPSARPVQAAQPVQVAPAQPAYTPPASTPRPQPELFTPQQDSIVIFDSGDSSYANDKEFRSLMENPAYLRNESAVAVQQMRITEIKKVENAPTATYAGSLLFGTMPAVD